MMLFFLASCSGFFQSAHHRHLELVRVQKERLGSFAAPDFHFTDTLPALAFTASAINDSALSPLIVHRGNTTVPFSDPQPNEESVNLKTTSVPADTLLRTKRKDWPQNKTALWSGVLGGISTLSPLLWPVGIAGGIVGLIALRKFKKNPLQRGRGCAYVAIIIGIISLLMGILIVWFIIECTRPDAMCI